MVLRQQYALLLSFSTSLAALNELSHATKGSVVDSGMPLFRHFVTHEHVNCFTTSPLADQ